MFGPHLIIDGSKCNTEKLGDRLLIERILTEYPRAIGMTRIGGPYMFEYQAPDPAYSGVSGLVVIAESHIAIHTFPALDYFTMDIFSCKNFDHEVAIDYIRDALDVREMDRMLVQRGLSFRGPHHGPLGATDELLAAAAARNESLGVTIGSIPTDDPLYPKAVTPDAGRMLWPTYGLSPDLGAAQPESAITSGGVRGGAVVIPANAAAAGELARPGFAPVQPVQLNPTASTSGVLDRMATLGGQGRKLGQALARWEAAARLPAAPVVLALGAGVIADGLRDLVTDLMQRGHVSAVVLAGDNVLADAYESLGYRHYVRDADDDAIPARSPEEWDAARAEIARMLQVEGEPRSSQHLAQRLGAALQTAAPRPGVLMAAAQREIPVFAVNAAELAEVGVASLDCAADHAALAEVFAQAGATLITFGATAALNEWMGETQPATRITVELDASVALPLLATGLVQRIPQRVQHHVQPEAHPTTEERTLQPVG